MPAQRRLIPPASVLCACLGLAACGGGSHASKQTTASAHDSATAATQAATTSALPPPRAASPQTLVAQVAGKPIRFGAVEHVMAMQSPREPLPDPPSYAGCVARLKAAQAAKAGEGAAQQTEAQLKQGCQKRYEGLLQAAVSKAIHSQWLIGEAAEEGIGVSDEEVLREFDLGRKSFKTNAEFDAYRKSTGQSIQDMLFEIKVGKVADVIFKQIKQKEHAATDAEVAAYYAAHRQQFTIPAGRDLHIFRTTTEAAAINAKKEIQAGKSFAEVAKQLSAIGQPIGAEQGEVRDLLPHAYGEKVLNDAIFSAQPNRLYGPLKITAAHRTIAPETNSGFFVFEVKRTIPGRQTPLAKVKATIAQKLTTNQKNQTVSGFIAAFRRKWTARTDCQPGYVVRNCRQYKGADVGSADPYTL